MPPCAEVSRPEDSKRGACRCMDILAVLGIGHLLTFRASKDTKPYIADRARDAFFCQEHEDAFKGSI